MESNTDISLLEAALEMEKAARYAAERKLQEKQKELAQVIQKQKEDAHHLSSAIQPALIDSITAHLQTGILIENESGLVVTINTAFCKLFDIVSLPSSIIGNDLFQKKLFTPSLFVNYTYFLQRTNEILNNREEIRSDIIELKSGVVLERDYMPIFQQGTYKGHIWYYHNSTEKNSLEKKIQTQKHLYENILSKMPADIAVFNPEHAELFLNPIAIKDADLRKWVIEWMIGKQEKTNNNSGWEDAGAYRALFNKVIRKKEMGSVEETKINEFGIEEHFLRHLYPIVDHNNEITMLISYTTNITERVKAEQAILKAKFVTEEAAKAKEAFLANMSHEIRTPMNGIIGLTKLLQKTKLTPQQKKLTTLMDTTAEELLVVVNDILNIQKMAAGKIELEKIPFNPITQISATLSALKYKAKEKKIYLRLTKSAFQNFTLQGDPHRLNQILNNLIGNAIKFTLHGGVTVHVKTTTEKDKLLLHIRVKDTGIGIPKEKLNTIFLPFVQANETTTRQFGGTGLGLSICKNLVDLHGGTLTVSSIPEKGTSFEIILPYNIANTDPKERNTYTIHGDEMNGKKILIAEDGALNSFIAEEYLHAYGATTKIVETGMAAITCVQKEHYDVVLMDIAMPEMDGISATKKIRSLANTQKANIPIIALTANVHEKDIATYLAAGMQAFIPKPFTEDVLIKTILQVCEKKDVTLYDATTLNRSGRGKPQFIEKMVSLFLSTAPADIALLEKAVIEKNWSMVHQTAHRMKSSFDGMGIQSLKSTIRMVEQLAKSHPNEEQLHQLLDKICSTSKKVMIALQHDFPKNNLVPSI
jgi:two-component system, sensor histidine kinase